jgi:hypothetical protein
MKFLYLKNVALRRKVIATGTVAAATAMAEPEHGEEVMVLFSMLGCLKVRLPDRITCRPDR